MFFLLLLCFYVLYVSVCLKRVAFLENLKNVYVCLCECSSCVCGFGGLTFIVYNI